MKFIDTITRNLNHDGATVRSFDATLAATSAGRGHYAYWLGTAGPAPKFPTAQIFNKNCKLIGQVSLIGGEWK